MTGSTSPKLRTGPRSAALPDRPGRTRLAPLSRADLRPRATGPPRTASPTRRRIVWSAGVVATVYLVLALVFSLSTPAWENSDEADHTRYTERIVRDGRLPAIAGQNGGESHQTPLYYLALAGWQEALGIPLFEPDPVRPAVAVVRDGVTVQSVDHRYDAAHARQARWLHELRLFSVLCGLLTVLAAYATGYLLTRRTPVAAAVAATVATWPKFLVTSAAVTNSALVQTMCAVAVPCWLMWRRRRSPTWAAATGAVLGAAVLAQLSAAPLAGLLGGSLVVSALRRGDRRSPVAALVCAVAVCGWWFVWNVVRYGDPLAVAQTTRYLRAEFPGLNLIRAVPSSSPRTILDAVPQLVHSTWYSGGWDQLLLPGWVDTCLWVLAGLSLLAALATRLGRTPVVWAAALASVAVWVAIVRQTPHGQGRYLLTGVAAWSTLFVSGSSRLPRAESWAIWLWPLTFVSVDLWVVATYLVPYGGL